MKKRLLIILSAILLVSLFFGCTAQNNTPEPTTDVSISSTSELSTKSLTSKETTKEKSKETSAASTKKQSTTEKKPETTTKKAKKEASSKPETTSAASTKKQHSQVENYCYISIECKTINENLDKLKEGHEKYVPENGVILPRIKCTFKKGETAYDILKKVCDKKGIRLTSRETVYGIYVSGINNIDEFDCGRESGWTYRVNSSLPSKSCDKYTLSPGDDIVFRFICTGTD